MDRLQLAVARAKEKKRDAGLEVATTVDLAKEDLGVSNFQNLNEESLLANRIVAGLNDVRGSQSFRLLRTKILSQMKSNGWKSIAVTSPFIDQGKSTIAANLAMAMSMEVTQSVLAVDVDLRRPNLHRAFGIEPQTGLSDILNSDTNFADACINLGSDRLTVLPGRGALSNSSEWLSGPAMQKLFTEFRSWDRSRYIVYDMPPLLRSDDVLKTVKNFDCLLLVVEDGKNTVDDIKQAMETVRHTNFVGYVLNKADSFVQMIGLNSESK